jgi:hypothetical protein
MQEIPHHRPRAGTEEEELDPLTNQQVMRRADAVPIVERWEAV